MFVMAGMYNMNDLLNLVAREAAEELRLEPGMPPTIILQGKSRIIDASLVTDDNVSELFRSIATEEQRRELARCGDIHFTFVAQNSARFSVSAAMQRESLTLRIRNLAR